MHERAVLGVLTGYLGTGYAFGIHHLAAAFPPGVPRPRPAHVVVVSDHDLFTMLEEQRDGRRNWDVARAAIESAGAGGTYVLHMAPDWEEARVRRMRDDGWAVYAVRGWEDVVAFARDFSRRRWGREEGPGG